MSDYRGQALAGFVAVMRRHGCDEGRFAAMAVWLEETLSDLKITERAMGEAIRVCQAHGCPKTSFPDFREWLESRLETSDQLVLKEAEVDPPPLFSSPQQPERSGFARQLRAGQERSAQQAMILMANDLQKAYQQIEALKSKQAESRHWIEQTLRWLRQDHPETSLALQALAGALEEKPDV